MEDETFDDALVRRGFLKNLFHRFLHGKPAANEPGKRDFAGDDGEDEDALLDDLEEKMAALNPEERFDWKGFASHVGKHVAQHLTSHLKERDLAEEGDAEPEGFDELTPEEKGWWHSVANHAAHAAIDHYIGK
ncbi:uncharacterized protein [Apostichopus japonicus]|uniref:uncharacterized protein n=1 Tax=Stichopus japonicus TaxID=307972 RepID=UPI003AB41049